MRGFLAPPPVPCPSCGARASWHYFRTIFDCPDCGATLRIHGSHMVVVSVVGLLLGVLTLYVASGFPGPSAVEGSRTL